MRLLDYNSKLSRITLLENCLALCDEIFDHFPQFDETLRQL